MDIKGIVRSAVQVANVTIGDLRKSVTIKLNPEAGTYDPVTDAMTGGTPAEVTVLALKYRSREQASGDVTGKYHTLMVTSYELAEAGYTGNLEESDTVTIEGIEWHVDSVAPDQLPLAGVIEKGAAYLRAGVDRAEHVTTCAMEEPRDRAEGFPLGAFAAAGRAKQEVGFVLHRSVVNKQILCRCTKSYALRVLTRSVVASKNTRPRLGMS